MRVVLDLQSCQTPSSRGRGIGRYSMALAQALQARGELDVRIAVNASYPEGLEEIRAAFSGTTSEHKITSYKPFAEQQQPRRAELIRDLNDLLLRKHYASITPDIVHTTSLFESDPGAGSLIKVKEVAAPVRAVTLYDLIPLIFDQHYLAHSATRTWYHSRVSALREFELILAISEATRQDAINLLGIAPDRVVNISGAADDHFRPLPNMMRQFPSLGIVKPFVMYTGGIDFRKNIPSLIFSYASLDAAVRENCQLVIVCRAHADQSAALMAIAEQTGLKPSEVVLAGFVPDDVLVELYNACTAFIFPSLYEGFGLPVLEAMKCGAPVIAANNSSLPEIVGRTDALFDAASPASIAQAIRRVLNDVEFRNSLVESGLRRAAEFSWAGCAQRVSEAYTRAVDRAKSRARILAVVNCQMQRPKVAYLSPLPPCRSGIAAYSAELLPELSKFIDLDLYVDNESFAFGVKHGFCVRPFQELADRAREYKSIIYQMGNSHFHAHMCGLLEQAPGIVVLHDFFLSGLMYWICAQRGAPHEFFSEIAKSHGEAAGASGGDLRAKIMAWPCNRGVIENATGLILHSTGAAFLRQEFFPATLCPRHVIIPHLRSLPEAGETARAAARQPLALDRDDLVIATFGIIAEEKLTCEVVQAFEGIARTIPHAKLLIVGEVVDADYAPRLAHVVDRSAARDRIRMTGYVAPQQYRNYVQATDIAVQLRGATRGETSRALMDVLAAGVPAVVNESLTFSDYPADILVRVPDGRAIDLLQQAILKLCDSPNLRAEMGRKARLYVGEHHAPASVAERYVEAIDRFRLDRQSMGKHSLVRAVAELFAPAPELDELLPAAVSALVDRGCKCP
jgi:glycosyltransferase involved in cell wall biosynthesis